MSTSRSRSASATTRCVCARTTSRGTSLRASPAAGTMRTRKRPPRARCPSVAMRLSAVRRSGLTSAYGDDSDVLSTSTSSASLISSSSALALRAGTSRPWRAPGRVTVLRHGDHRRGPAPSDVGDQDGIRAPAYAGHVDAPLARRAHHHLGQARSRRRPPAAAPTEARRGRSRTRSSVLSVPARKRRSELHAKGVLDLEIGREDACRWLRVVNHARADLGGQALRDRERHERLVETRKSLGRSRRGWTYVTLSSSPKSPIAKFAPA